MVERGPKRPLRVDGGLTLRSKRGEIAQTWWSRRFIEVLESFGMGGRLDRGRAYARTGQVLSMSLSTSMVLALVAGSRPNPYRARIGVKKFDDDEWRLIERALAGQAIFTAKLLAGEMPVEVEEVFAELGLALFPSTMRELSMDCTCPDWEVPCKHLAATCYLLAESFDTDPFEIFAWRGRERGELLENLRALRGAVREQERRQEEVVVGLEDCLDTFWERPTVAAVAAGDLVAGPPDAVLDQLDPLPLVVRKRNVADLLRPAYRAMVEGPPAQG
ncbi:SWIM zinc finger family protein [Umezawaea tangerina]|uniref:Putative Zn finger protein n=1 Tax=Umezawaea tangerina TaxID=84725 RepID=A0A2T0SSK8_9PSEU|nr:SWIM zinc finger family protein [Umezawaea tangerina]PRY36401.1 putative Zn finger protein [Umezawaea tangerina]